VDPENGPLELTAFDAMTYHGAAVTRSGGWLFVSKIPAQGSDAFAYSIEDNAGQVASATVFLRGVPDTALTANLLAVTVESGGVRIRFAGIPNRTYRIEFTPAL